MFDGDIKEFNDQQVNADQRNGKIFRSLIWISIILLVIVTVKAF